MKTPTLFLWMLFTASALVVIPACASDYTLGIFGNANMDDTIDEDDVEYVEGIIDGTNEETQLADANHDGQIDEDDLTQIELTMLGEEKELTILDGLGRAITIEMPLERIVSIAGSYGPETFCALGVQDKLVGVASYAKENSKQLEEFLQEIPAVGSSKSPDVEVILNLNPQIVHSYECYYDSQTELEETLNSMSIHLVPLDFHKPTNFPNAIMTIGYLLNEQNRAQELIDFEEYYLGLIDERTEMLEDEDKPTVYLESYLDYRTAGPGSSENDNALPRCGGINIFDDVTGVVYIDPESVIRRNPEVVLRLVHDGQVLSGYGVTDVGPINELREQTINRPGWESIDAVKNNRVYLISTSSESTHMSVFLMYVAKCLHPELFEDVDPEQIYEEWFHRFLGVDYLGVYAYPPPSSW
jgi:iron complex transport system substrate-binding protein